MKFLVERTFYLKGPNKIISFEHIHTRNETMRSEAMGIFFSLDEPEIFISS